MLIHQASLELSSHNKFASAILILQVVPPRLSPRHKKPLERHMCSFHIALEALREPASLWRPSRATAPTECAETAGVNDVKKRAKRVMT